MPRERLRDDETIRVKRLDVAIILDPENPYVMQVCDGPVLEGDAEGQTTVHLRPQLLSSPLADQEFGIDAAIAPDQSVCDAGLRWPGAEGDAEGR